MRTNIPERLLKIADGIGERGNVNLTRLVVLKKWFEKPERLSAFAIWIVRRATSHKGKTGGAAAELFREAKALLAEADKCSPQLDRQKAQTLHDQLRDFQNEYRKQRWGEVRIIHNWNLMLVEHALAIYLWHMDSPANGYKLAADYCQNYGPQYGNGLNGPSRTKNEEIIRFMFTSKPWRTRRTETATSEWSPHKLEQSFRRTCKLLEARNRAFPIDLI